MDTKQTSREDLKVAIKAAIDKVGMEVFKGTSMFMSNNKPTTKGNEA